MNTSSNLLLHDSFSRLVSPDPAIIVIEHEDVYEETRRIERIRREVFEEAEKKWELRFAEEKEKNRKLWAALDSSFEIFMKQVEAQIARQLIDLSVKLAEIIIRRELPDRTMVKDVIGEILAPVSDLQGAKVRVNPGDHDILMKARQESGRQDLTARLEIVADDSLMPGDVLIESKNGYFDARISERLKLLQEKLMERSHYSDEHNAKS
jgi:flagellar biosynthesis/type III secretory pathway protein FliH